VVRSIQSTSPESRLCTPQVTIRLQHENRLAAEDVDIIILGSKSSAYEDILRDPELRQGILRGEQKKTLISIVGGVTIAQLESALYGVKTQQSDSTNIRPDGHDSKHRCTIIRAVPNMAARNQESMTVLSSSNRPGQLEDEQQQANRLFALIGPTITLPEAQLNHASALAGSPLAFYANIISAAASGALNDKDGEGLSPKDALFISAQAARGVSGLMITGQSPQDIVADVATKGGSTAAGLGLMVKKDVYESITGSVEECSRATAKLSNAYKDNGDNRDLT
jgi:pyrroline-5-carboxylate reductase